MEFKNFVHHQVADARENEVLDQHFDVHDYVPEYDGVAKDVVGETKQNADNARNSVVVEEVIQHPTNSKRLIFRGEAAKGTGATGVHVPKHMWYPKNEKDHDSMSQRNQQRGEVYGHEHRAPLTIPEANAHYKKTIEEHGNHSEKEQIAKEKEAVGRIQRAKHLPKTGNVYDKSEKLDSINFEEDKHGRKFHTLARKGVAGHAVYTSGSGKDEKHHILNTCPGQTSGCGGGINEKGEADVSKGACFAHNAETQYKGASRRRASITQMAHDPKMAGDYALAAVHHLRKESTKADKAGKLTVIRPNTLDEDADPTHHAIDHLNKDRVAKGKAPIITYQYSKANKLHDPENGKHVTFSNIGPKVKDGRTISENAARDNSRVRQTIEHQGKQNAQGHDLPAKHSYVVTNQSRGGKAEEEFKKHVTHAKYWSSGRESHELSDDEKKQGPEGHFNHKGAPTTEDKAHYGHTTVNGRRYDYQKQHVLHTRMVNVNGHSIPSDARFKDDEHLPEDKHRFKSKHGNNAGALVATSPTSSTSNQKQDSSFTHNVDHHTIEHAKTHRGEWEIDHPHDQEKARGKEWAASQPLVFMKKPKKAAVKEEAVSESAGMDRVREYLTRDHNAKEEKEAHWNSQFQAHVCKLSPKHTGKIKWSEVHHFRLTGQEPVDAAQKYVASH